jgi:molybdenum cofactor cytidylyltransferase
MIQEIPTAGIILAAGASTRFGRPKQLLRLKGRYLIEWVLDAAVNSKLNQVVLVLGHAHEKILQALDQKLQHAKIYIQINPEFEKGQSTSLRAGLSKVKDDFAAVMFILGDQPMLSKIKINKLLESYWSTEKNICVPVYKGVRKNPTVFSRRFYHQLMKIEGDSGGRQLIDANHHQVLEVEIDDPLCFLDVDTKKDLEQLKALMLTEV